MPRGALWMVGADVLIYTSSQHRTNFISKVSVFPPDNDNRELR
jgi:hypothetical protein